MSTDKADHSAHVSNRAFMERRFLSTASDAARELRDLADWMEVRAKGISGVTADTSSAVTMTTLMLARLMNLLPNVGITALVRLAEEFDRALQAGDLGGTPEGGQP
jgi:hypothetical protein